MTQFIQSQRFPWLSLLLRYGGSFLTTATALAIWFLWPVMHEDPLVIFVAGVIVSARFFGFGPALLCTGLSALALNYFIFMPRFSVMMASTDAERMVVFAIVSVLTAGLARQRSRAEVSAGEAKQRMAAIVESSDDAILSATPAGIITSWNRGAETLYGYSSEEATGHHISFLALKGHEREITRNALHVRLGQPIDSYQADHMRKDGSKVRVLFSMSPLRNSRGEVIGSSAIARDITAQQRTEDVLRRNERLATAGRLAATIAHEINNPLEAVTNLLYLARHDADRREHYLALAEKEVERVAAIAQQTLGFVREGASPVLLNVRDAIEQVLYLYTRKLESKQIRVDKQYENGVNICGFLGELRQLFSNLVINSVDSMAHGGRLLIRVSRAHDWSDGRREGVRVSIADTGTGIRPEDRARLFEPFFTTKQEFGTGLGLWISQGIVHKHGGSIRVRSRIDLGRSGTVFSVFLPKANGAVQAA